MNKYVVKMAHVFSTIAEVEAANKEEALDKAEQWFMDSETKDDSRLYYEATVDKKNWAVITTEEYEELKAKVKAEIENKEGQSSNIITPNNFN